jgi:hypothetical protein
MGEWGALLLGSLSAAATGIRRSAQGWQRGSRSPTGSGAALNSFESRTARPSFQPLRRGLLPFLTRDRL